MRGSYFLNSTCVEELALEVEETLRKLLLLQGQDQLNNNVLVEEVDYLTPSRDNHPLGRFNWVRNERMESVQNRGVLSSFFLSVLCTFPCNFHD